MYEVQIDLRTGHLCPQVLLQTALLPYAASPAVEAERLPLAGPYTPAGDAGAAHAEATYLFNLRYFAAAATQPREIVERRFADPVAAAAALRRGGIQVLERLNPWQAKSLARHADLVVQPYALPRVHCLIPNARKPLTSSRTFRRALAYGINRRAVLEERLRGERLPGCVRCTVRSPRVIRRDDPLAYACESEIKPWPYEPRLAGVLAEAGRREPAAARVEAAPRRGRRAGARLAARRHRADRVGDPPAACRH